MSFLKKNGGIFDVIRCDEPSYLIWKWHPNGVEPGKGKREYSIRTNSTLRVKDGEVAVFVYHQKDGTMQDYIVGPFDQKLKTANLPVLSGLLGLFYEGDSPFQAEIYFVNLAEIIQINFGVPFFNVVDPRFQDFVVPVAVRGTLTFKIEEYKKFIKFHRLIDFDIDTFKEQVKTSINRYVKDVVTNTPSQHNIPVVQIETKISEINDSIELLIKDRFVEDFGVTVSSVDIATLEIDKTSEDYINLMSITKDITTATIKTQTEANLEHYTESLRIQREEGQYAQHKQTQTANLGAFTIEKQTEVGIAAAQALAQMGANGAGDVNLGGAGLNPTTMMAGMAVGGAVGQNIAGIINNTMNPNQSNVTPPPVPTLMFFVAVNGTSTGPYDIPTLTQMAKNGQFNGQSLVWRQEMLEWQLASNVNELADVLTNAIPPIPR